MTEMIRWYSFILTISVTVIGLSIESNGDKIWEDTRSVDYLSDEKDVNDNYNYNNDIPALPTTRQVLQRLIDKLQSNDRPYKKPDQFNKVDVDKLAIRLSKTLEDFVSKRHASTNCYDRCKSKGPACLAPCLQGK